MIYIHESDTLTGVERYPYSQAFGELVVPKIALRHSPGIGTPVGYLEHGSPVDVLEKRNVVGRPWYRVRYGEQEGWVLAAFLEKLGEEDAKRL